MRRIISLLICVPLLLALCACSVGSYSFVVLQNWKLELPSGGEETYSAHDEASFNGDGVRYHVIEYAPSSEIDHLAGFSAEERETIFFESLEAAAEGWLDELNVPREQRPDYVSCDWLYMAQPDNSELIIYRSAEKNTLYIIEDFM